MGLALAILVLAAVLVAVAYPLWLPARAPSPGSQGAGERLSELRERKEMLYASIRELGLDFRAGKLTEEDYREEVERLKSEAVAVVEAIEEAGGSPPRASEEVEAEIVAIRERLEEGGAAAPPTGDRDAAPKGDRFCTRCGRRVGPDDRFCAGCGTRLVEPAGRRP